MELVRASDARRYFRNAIQRFLWPTNRCSEIVYDGFDTGYVYTPYIPLSLTSSGGNGFSVFGSLHGNMNITPPTGNSQKLRTRWNKADAHYLYKIECPCCHTTVKLGYDKDKHRQHYVMDSEYHAPSCVVGWRRYMQVDGMEHTANGGLQDAINKKYWEYCYSEF